jgi:hypothetical protein
VTVSVPWRRSNSSVARWTAPALRIHSNVGFPHPAVGPCGSLVAVGLVVDRLELVKPDIDAFGAEEVSLLTRPASTDDQEARLPEPLEALADVGQCDRIVQAPGLADRGKGFPISLLALRGERLRRGPWLQVGEHACDGDQVAQPPRGDTASRNTLLAETSVTQQEHARSAEEFVGQDHRLAQFPDGRNGALEGPGQREAIDKVAANAVLQRYGVLHVVRLANGDRHEFDSGTALLQQPLDLLLAGLNIVFRVRPARAFPREKHQANPNPPVFCLPGEGRC